MKKFTVGIALMLIVTSSSFAQSAPSGKTLAATVDVYVFPGQGQAADQQSKDEVECYNWAVNNTGNDPFDLTKQSATQAQETEAAKAEAAKTGQGRGARGAVRGAAVGALIGEIADDDAGKGAAYGAAAGAIAGRRRGARDSAQAQQSVEDRGQAQQQATQTQIENFKKAFSVCLEAKDYMVKY